MGLAEEIRGERIALGALVRELRCDRAVRKNLDGSTSSETDQVEIMSASRVLVVDDDRSNSLLVSKVLSGQGYAVDIATDGLSALRLVDEHRYSLAVIDYQMPGMNGVELFRAAREKQPELPGIFLTAHANINTVFPAIEAGIERVLAKPLNSAELIRLAASLTRPGAGSAATT
jgi:CheY-like chemotaxis protein